MRSLGLIAILFLTGPIGGFAPAPAPGKAVKPGQVAVGKPDANGLVTARGTGDTHVVVFYDGAVEPVPVLRAVTDRAGEAFPQVAAPTAIDQFVVGKLRRLGIVPSELCNDAEFLRRVSLDITGTLPTAQEVEAFLTDASPDKRSRKIDELLERPTYAAWWATWLNTLSPKLRSKDRWRDS